MIGRIVRLLIAAAAVVLASCGGGGGTCAFGEGCPGGGGTQVSDLVITLSSQSITNSGNDTVTATVTALNSNRNALSGVSVTTSVDSNAVANVSGTTTGSDGTVSATIGIGADKSNRTVTLTAKSGTLSKTATFQITGTKLTSNYTNAVPTGSTGNVVSYTLTDINGIALSGIEITVTATGLSTVSGTTDNAGHFDFVYDAPTAAGSLVITGSAAGVENVANVQVQASGIVGDAVGPISSASVSASPNTVSVNVAGSTANQAQIQAKFVRPDNSRVQNVRVRFDLDGDPNSVGGVFSSGNTMLYSAADGTVTVSYIPGALSSPTDGVSVRACWSLTDFAQGTCPNAVRTSLTVTSEAISVTIGTNGSISIGDAGLTYIKQYVVQVVDSAGNAMPGVTISPVVDLGFYRKGSYELLGVWGQVVSATCANEDLNRNGVLDAGEDVNNNGKLEPRKADVSIRMVGSNTTDASGLAIVQIEYPQNVASWDYYTITVTASGVSGTEGRATYSSWLEVLASAITNTTATPAFRDSPYGFGSCTDPD